MNNINNLDLSFYKNFYKDLSKLSNKELISHYIKYGKSENRFINILDFYNNNPKFNINNYKNNIKYVSDYYFNNKKSNNNESTNKKSNNNESTNKKSNNNESTNKKSNNNESANKKSNNNESANKKSNNNESTNKKSNNNESTNKKSNNNESTNKKSNNNESDNKKSNNNESTNTFYKLYPDFNLKFYKLYNDLDFKNEINYLNHYHLYGKNEDRIINQKKYYEMYSEFNLDFYKNLNNDLKFKNDITYLTHYHNYGRNENRIINQKIYYQRYPTFNLDYYKNFNTDLSFENDIGYFNHYYTYGKNNNEDYFNYDVDFTDNNFYKKLNNDLKDRLYDHYLLRKIDKYNELLNYNEKYQKKFFIYNRESFYKLYSDFNLEFYKNKYFNNSDKSDFDIMLYYHTHGKYNGDLINNKIKIIIYTHPFDIKCGGIVVLHYLSKLINEYNPDKYYAKLFLMSNLRYKNIFCNDFASIHEINDNTVVIYPEIISGNPLNGKNVVRWILLELGIEMPIDHYKNWGSTDLIYHWEPKDSTLNLLRKHYLNPIFYIYNNDDARNKTCYLIKKGKLIHSTINYFHPKNSINIEDLTLEEIANVFNKCKYFYIYDLKTMYTIYALLCGCIPIIYPLKDVSKEEHFKTTIFYNDGIIYNKGIAYGNSQEEIDFATNTLNEGINDINLIFEKEINTVYNFLHNLNDVIK